MFNTVVVVAFVVVGAFVEEVVPDGLVVDVVIVREVLVVEVARTMSLPNDFNSLTMKLVRVL